MESLSKQELIGTITKQADQIKRYETRLRDVVAAYKGLVKEKEALEISLKALNRTETLSEEGQGDDSVAALTLSLSTLSAEKTRMEEAFQADKKVTRDKYENQIAAMREETKSLVQQHLAEVHNLKAKIAYEIQEREKERTDHAAMLKELHLKLNSERKSKEKLENDVAHSNEAESCQAELEKRVRDLSISLEASERKVARASARANDTPAALRRLNHQLHLLQQDHDRAIREEQIKVKRAEESARKICARQEERVALLEGKLAELSQTIGEYDLRKRKDEQVIKQLKETINAKLLERDDGNSKAENHSKSETDNEKLADSEYIQTLIDRIHILKKELVAENEKMGFPIDVTAVFKIEGYENIHTKCKEELERVRNEFSAYKHKHENEIRINNEALVADLNMQIDVLKKKLETYKMVLEEEKRDKEAAFNNYEERLKSEKKYHLEERSELVERVERLERRVEALQLPPPARPSTNVTAPPHMLHYVEELARKDLDISQLRKEKHILEGNYRDCQRESTIEKERFKEVIRTLKEEIDRLRRSQSREGANLEYLKNVVMAYLMSTDYAGRKHMLNAIAAVLHFTDKERTMVLSIL